MASESSRSFASGPKEADVGAGLRKPSLAATAAAATSDVVVDGLDVLRFIEFQWDGVSTRELSGHFTVTPKTCQPFGVLHGGVTAFVAEALASMGAQVNTSWARVAGIDLSVSHLMSVALGDQVFVKATPLRVGKRVQVWDVKFTTAVKSDVPTSQEFSTTAVARLTLLVALPDPEKARDGNEKLIAIAKTRNMGLLPSKL